MTNGGEKSHQTEILPGSYPKFIVAINSALHGLVHDYFSAKRGGWSKRWQARKGKGGK